MLGTLTAGLPQRGLMRLSQQTRCAYDMFPLPHLSVDIWEAVRLETKGLMSRKRVFLLGLSHHTALSGIALSPFASYSTPLGDIPLDLQGEPRGCRHTANPQSSRSSRTLARFPCSTSTRMKMSIRWKCTSRISGMSSKGMLSLASPASAVSRGHARLINPNCSPSTLPRQLSVVLTCDSRRDDLKLVPLIVGHSHGPDNFSKILERYYKDPETFFIVSTDFCHW